MGAVRDERIRNRMRRKGGGRKGWGGVEEMEW